jgi:hypothetical protein
MCTHSPFEIVLDIDRWMVFRQTHAGRGLRAGKALANAFEGCQSYFLYVQMCTYAILA